MEDVRTRGVALVTGASRGIGLELARELAARGYPLVLAARNEERLAAAAAALSGEHGVRVDTVAVDLSRPEGPSALAAAMRERGVEPEILVNNAGAGMRRPFVDVDEGYLQALLQLNVASVAQLSRVFVRGMVARGRGHVLNVASAVAFVPAPFMAAYLASKAFVLSLTAAVNQEIRGTGVTATALCPGFTRTDFTAALFGSAPPRGMMSASSVARAGVQGMLAGRAVVVPGARYKLVFFASGLGRGLLTARIGRMLREPVIDRGGERQRS